MTPSDVAVLVLASGLSQRFGEGNKLLASLSDKPLAAHCIDAVQQAGFHSLYAVVPFDDQALSTLFADNGFSLVFNPQPQTGQGASLALGVGTILQSNAEGVLIMLADMPFIRERDLLNLCAGLEGHAAAVSLYEGSRLPPVLFTRPLFERAAKLSGDEGGKSLLRTIKDVAEVPLRPSAAIDIDTAEALAGHNHS